MGNDPSKRPRVFMDLRHGDRDLGRIEMELYSDKVPRTAENFRALCTGERKGKSGKPLHYKGDITRGDGTGGESIYGKHFADERFGHHSGPGILSMANSGRNTNASQFFITFNKASTCDGKHVVFGHVVAGFEDVCRAVEHCRVDGGQEGGSLGRKTARPDDEVVVVDCGQLFPAGGGVPGEKKKNKKKKSGKNDVPCEQ